MAGRQHGTSTCSSHLHTALLDAASYVHQSTAPSSACSAHPGAHIPPCAFSVEAESITAECVCLMPLFLAALFGCALDLLLRCNTASLPQCPIGTGKSAAEMLFDRTGGCTQPHSQRLAVQHVCSSDWTATVLQCLYRASPALLAARRTNACRICFRYVACGVCAPCYVGCRDCRFGGCGGLVLPICSITPLLQV